MRVLFITYELPPIGGGGGRAVWQIARRLAAHGHAVSILTSLFERLRPFEEVDGVRIHRLCVRRKRAAACPPSELLSFMLRSVPAAARLAEPLNPTVVCAFFGIPGGPAAWWLKRTRRIPYVLSLRGSDVPRAQLARHQKLHRFTRPFLRAFYRDADGIVAVSQGLRDAANRVEPRVRIEVIPNGIDLEQFRPHAREPAAVPETELLVVGRLQEFKGVQHLIQALPLVEAELGRPVRLTVVGDGPFRATLESLASRIKAEGARSEVHFTGWLDAERVRSFYERASVVVLPSLVEGHPNVLLEGMASGLPCIATDVPGTNELLTNEHEGLLVPPENAQALAKAVARVLSNPDTWGAMSRRARARAEQFSWDRIASQYESLLSRAEKKTCDISFSSS